MVHDGIDRSSRMQRLIQLSDELKELSDRLQEFAGDGASLPVELLNRNRDIVRRCDEFASEMSAA